MWRRSWPDSAYLPFTDFSSADLPGTSAGSPFVPRSASASSIIVSRTAVRTSGNSDILISHLSDDAQSPFDQFIDLIHVPLSTSSLQSTDMSFKVLNIVSFSPPKQSVTHSGAVIGGMIDTESSMLHAHSVDMRIFPPWPSRCSRAMFQVLLIFWGTLIAVIIPIVFICAIAYEKLTFESTKNFPKSASM